MRLLRRLDDRVIGRAERDPAARRRADAWANGILLLIAVGIAVACLVADHGSAARSPGMWVLIGFVAAGAVARLVRSRSR